MHWIQVVEFSFYLVETFALPFAILVFLYERRKERYVDEEEIYQRLSDEYTNFLKLVLDNSDLQLLRKHAPLAQLTEEQMERKLALFGILVSIFERAASGHPGKITCASGVVVPISARRCRSCWRAKTQISKRTSNASHKAQRRLRANPQKSSEGRMPVWHSTLVTRITLWRAKG